MGLLISWQVKNKQILLIGGGSVAKTRFDSLVAAGATNITIIASNIEDELLQAIEAQSAEQPGAIETTLFRRPIKESDFSYNISKDNDKDANNNNNNNIRLFDMVLSAINDRAASEMISRKCHELRIPVNCADIPPQCDFYFGSMINRGPLQVMISTNGQSPRLAVKIREALQKTVDDLDPENAIRNMGKLRQCVRDKTNGSTDPVVVKTRMQWISKLSDSLSFSEMAQLNDGLITSLVSRYPNDPSDII